MSQAPEGPTDVSAQGWVATLKRAGKEFSDDRLTTWAAALTYYAVLSIFPALLALVSILGLFGDSAIQPLIDNVATLAPGPGQEILTDILTSLQSSGGQALIPFAIGLAAAIWSASGYIGAFMDASNSIWEVEEGRPIYKKLPIRVGITVVMLVLITVLALATVVTGPLAERVGDIFGVGGSAVDVWNIAKWPVIALVVAFMFAFLYWAAPNVKHPKFQWVSPGGLLAVLGLVVASGLFALYVAFFPPNPAYGALGGIIAFLTWLWISNVVILFGAEFNAELERGRQIEAGMPPEQEPYLEPRDEPKDD